MNFIDTMEGPNIQLELKYCERCGGLFLRPLAADLMYCVGCAAHLAAPTSFGREPVMVTRRENRAVRERQQLGLRRKPPCSSVQIERLQGVAAWEVEA